MSRTTPLALALTLAACGSTSGPGTGRAGFEVATVPVCQPDTRFVAVKTQFGGRMRLDVLDRCGAVLDSCDAPDQLAPRARTGFRTAGLEVLTAGCVLAVDGAARLRVTFDGGDEAEVYEASFAGVCVELSECSDGGVDARMPDAAPADAAPDATVADATAADADLVEDAGPLDARPDGPCLGFLCGRDATIRRDGSADTP